MEPLELGPTVGRDQVHKLNSPHVLGPGRRLHQADGELASPLLERMIRPEIDTIGTPVSQRASDGWGDRIVRGR